MTKIIGKDSPYVLGIDLGTTNTAIAVYKAGKAEIISIYGEKTLPSVMSVLGNGDILVGKQAKPRTLIDPENTVSSIKRKMGQEWKKTFEGLPGKEYTPADISAEILSKLVSCVQENDSVDLKGNPKFVVICVPANFDDVQKKATEEAAKLANLEIMQLLEEPSAAAYAYALDRECDQTILVYDLGGGTFDVSILKVDSTEGTNKKFKVLSKEGIQELGGDDFDRKLMEICSQKLKETSAIDILDLKKDQGISEKRLLEAQQKLKEIVMNAKHELTDAMSARIELPNFIKGEDGKSHHIDMEITRTQFNEVIRDLILKTKETIQKALDGAKFKIGDIDRIIMVGGSTKVPLVKEVLTEMFGKEPYGNIDPDAAIACGAAILGSTLNLPSNIDTEKKDEADKNNTEIVKTDIVTHNLGIELAGGKFNCLIVKGTEILKDSQTTATKEYITPRDNMTELVIRIYQSPEEVEYVSSNDVKCIGEFFLTGIPPKPRGEERITVNFEINDQNLLKVKASSSTSSKELEITER